MLQADIANSPILQHVPSLVVAIGGLGTAAFGVVDATKSLGGGVSNYGFGTIAKVMGQVLSEKPAAATGATTQVAIASSLSLSAILVTLKSNWINGLAHDDQVAIAKSLVKMRMDASLAGSLATLTGVDGVGLLSVVNKIASATPLTQSESDVYTRFDLLLTTLLDQAYERADQEYRNMAKFAAMVASVLLAVAGWASLGQFQANFIVDTAFWEAVLIGLIATPLAPVAKDVASAIQAGAGAIQAWRS